MNRMIYEVSKTVSMCMSLQMREETRTPYLTDGCCGQIDELCQMSVVGKRGRVPNPMNMRACR